MLALAFAGSAAIRTGWGAESAAATRPIVSSARLDELNKSAPANIADLAAIQSQVRKVVDALQQSTVAIVVGDIQGSGVIVTPDGYVLTAAHVASVPGRKVRLTLPDGRQLTGRALGLNSAGDCGIVQINEAGPFPARPLCDSKSVKVGDWCIATGHPGGFQSDRKPVVRLGRVVAIRETMVQSDCPLLGGDSGGPLFDLNGNVIGVHSRIGARMTQNLHVPASLFLRDWDRLTKNPGAEQLSARAQGMLGVDGEDHAKGARLTNVYPGLPAHDARLQPGDIVTRIDDRPIRDFEALQQYVQSRRPGELLTIRVLRGTDMLDLPATLAARPE